MKTTSDQAIYDLSNAIYKLAMQNFKEAGQPVEKSAFLFECLIQMSDVKMEAGRITKSDHTIKYQPFDEKYIFWLVEAPEPSDKFTFLDYFTTEMTKIYYNLDPDTCIRE